MKNNKLEINEKIIESYNILKPLNLKNDVQIFINDYNMMIDCRNGIEKVEGFAKDVLKSKTLEIARSLEDMLLFNYAVKQALRTNKFIKEC